MLIEIATLYGQSSNSDAVKCLVSTLIENVIGCNKNFVKDLEQTFELAYPDFFEQTASNLNSPDVRQLEWPQFYDLVLNVVESATSLSHFIRMSKMVQKIALQQNLPTAIASFYDAVFGPLQTTLTDHFAQNADAQL